MRDQIPLQQAYANTPRKAGMQGGLDAGFGLILSSPHRPSEVCAGEIGHGSTLAIGLMPGHPAVGQDEGFAVDCLMRQ